ncbi:hypothetical protein EJ05DRAFT_484220 [Pseudovirgaria hyperparasitica]|uniref:Uncharacterized protein n=1 Tax=Pseudovirgaria hyperparasitica TaxID=470096 RepID=A0A6A6WD45_9PEZI|nr:uncharacterized protein EJ05DRAFT_484220 [Pseudovirgaria hyperparasitica]KAF2760495.1 hypothetical protein EJ05DRAFT_484220 [Pseudovirgaria hyperparasitica]
MGEARHSNAAVLKNNWLVTLGCCASWGHDEDYAEAELRCNVQEEDVVPVVDQPRPYHHTVSTIVSRWPTTSGHRSISRASRLSGSMSIDCRPANKESPPRRSTTRPPSLRPLELSIYEPKNRLSPLPDFTESDWTKVLPSLEFPEQAVVHSRPSSVSSTTTTSRFGGRWDSVRSENTTTTSVTRRSSSRLSLNPLIDLSLLHGPDFEDRPTALQTLPSIPDSPIPTTDKHSSTTTTSSSTIPLPSSPPQSHHNTHSSTPARSNPQRTTRPSFLSTRNEIDAAIRELKSIIQERRAHASTSTSISTLSSSSPSFSTTTTTSRPPPSPSHHIPALAPSHRIRARSETLSEIGSAFSVPWVCAKPLPLAPGQVQVQVRTPFYMAPDSPGFYSSSSSSGAEKAGAAGTERADRHVVSVLKESLASVRPRVWGWMGRAGAQGRHAQRPSTASTALTSASTSTSTSTITSASTLSLATTVPSLVTSRTSCSTARCPATPGGLSPRSARKGLGWGEGEVWGRKEEVEVEVGGRDGRVDPLRMNPRTPVGVAF